MLVVSVNTSSNHKVRKVDVIVKNDDYEANSPSDLISTLESNVVCDVSIRIKETELKVQVPGLNI